MDNPTTFIPKPPEQAPPTWAPPVNDPEALKPSKPMTERSLSEYLVGTLSMKKWEPSEESVIEDLGMEALT